MTPSRESPGRTRDLVALPSVRATARTLLPCGVRGWSLDGRALEVVDGGLDGAALGSVVQAALHRGCMEARAPQTWGGTAEAAL